MTKLFLEQLMPTKLQIFRSLPKDVLIACSGGVDSVALALFLKDSGKNVTLAHYQHPEDEQVKNELNFVEDFANNFNFPLITSDRVWYTKETSREEWWRLNRLHFFSKFNQRVLTGHHLDDAVEWYLHTAFMGEPHYMCYESENTLKPFILQRKQNLTEWMFENYPNVKYIKDMTNFDPNFSTRNWIRNRVIDQILPIAPGLYTSVKNKIIKKQNLIGSI